LPGGDAPRCPACARAYKLSDGALSAI